MTAPPITVLKLAVREPLRRAVEAMNETPSDPNQATVADVFRVVNEIRKTQAEMRGEHEDFRGSVEEKLNEIRRRLEGQTESALNVALHVLGEQRQKLREVIEWANEQGAGIDRLP